MNTFLRLLTHEQSQILYYTFHVISILGAIAFNLIYCKRFAISKTKAFSFTVIVFVGSYGLMYVWSWLDKALWGSGSVTSSRLVFIVPLLSIVLAKFWGMKKAVACDFMAPFFYVSRAIGKISCIFPGCCHGKPADWGMYSAVADTICFPLQLMEALGTFAVLWICVAYAKRYHYQCGGRSYAVGMAIFGCFRYIMEFFNTDERIFLQMTSNSFYAIAMILIGLTVFYILDRYARHHEMLEENRKVS